MDFRLSQGSVATYCRYDGNLCDVYIENFLTNHLVKEFWKSVHICQSYYQTSIGLLFFLEHGCILDSMCNMLRCSDCGISVYFNVANCSFWQLTIIQQYSDWYTGSWWVSCDIWYSEEGPGRAVVPPSPLIAVPNISAHPSTASVPTLYYLIWHYNN